MASNFLLDYRSDSDDFIQTEQFEDLYQRLRDDKPSGDLSLSDDIPAVLILTGRSGLGKTATAKHLFERLRKETAGNVLFYTFKSSSLDELMGELSHFSKGKGLNMDESIFDQAKACPVSEREERQQIVCQVFEDFVDKMNSKLPNFIKCLCFDDAETPSLIVRLINDVICEKMLVNNERRKATKPWLWKVIVTTQENYCSEWVEGCDNLSTKNFFKMTPFELDQTMDYFGDAFDSDTIKELHLGFEGLPLAVRATKDYILKCPPSQQQTTIDQILEGLRSFQPLGELGVITDPQRYHIGDRLMESFQNSRAATRFLKLLALMDSNFSLPEGIAVAKVVIDEAKDKRAHQIRAYALAVRVITILLGRNICEVVDTDHGRSYKMDHLAQLAVLMHMERESSEKILVTRLAMIALTRVVPQDVENRHDDITCDRIYSHGLSVSKYVERLMTEKVLTPQDAPATLLLYTHMLTSMAEYLLGDASLEQKVMELQGKALDVFSTVVRNENYHQFSIPNNMHPNDTDRALHLFNEVRSDTCHLSYDKEYDGIVDSLYKYNHENSGNYLEQHTPFFDAKDFFLRNGRVNPGYLSVLEADGNIVGTEIESSVYPIEVLIEIFSVSLKLWRQTGEKIIGDRARSFGDAILVLCEQVRSEFKIGLIDEPNVVADLLDLEIQIGKGNTCTDDLTSKCQAVLIGMSETICNFYKFGIKIDDYDYITRHPALSALLHSESLPHSSSERKETPAVQDQLERQGDELDRQQQRILELQEGAERPQQAVTRLQKLLTSTAEQFEQLTDQKAKLDETQELTRRQDEKQQQQIQDLHGRHNQLVQTVTENMNKITSLTNDVTALKGKRSRSKTEDSNELDTSDQPSTSAPKRPKQADDDEADKTSEILVVTRKRSWSKTEDSNEPGTSDQPSKRPKQADDDVAKKTSDISSSDKEQASSYRFVVLGKTTDAISALQGFLHSPEAKVEKHGYEAIPAEVTSDNQGINGLENGATASHQQAVTSHNDIGMVQPEVELTDEHAQILRLLSKPSEESVDTSCTTCTTCTLVSVKEPKKKGQNNAEPYHVLFLAPGHIQSVIGYDNKVDQYEWEISTIHTKRRRTYTPINNRSPRGAFHGLKSSCTDHFQHGALEVEICQENANILFKLISPSEVIDDVCGHYEKTEGQCCQFHDSDRSSYEGDGLYQLDNPGETLPVTIVTIKVTGVNDEGETTLYHLIAGHLEKNVEISHEGVEFLTTELSNDTLHHHIRTICEKDLYKMLSDTARASFESGASPCYIVTEQFPNDVEKIAGIKPKELEENGKKSYKYPHSDNSEMYVKVYEPASPATGEYSAGKKTERATLTTSPYHKRKQLLQKKQKEIFNFIRGHDQSDTENKRLRKDLLTVVISTILKDTETSSDVFIFRGIVADRESPNLSRLELKTSPGWLTTTHWISNRSIVETLGKEWDSVTKSLSGHKQRHHKSLQRLQFGFVNVNASSKDRLKIRVPEGRDVFSTWNSSVKEANNKDWTIGLRSSHFQMILNARYTSGSDTDRWTLSAIQTEYMGSKKEPQRYRDVEEKGMRQLSLKEIDLESVKNDLKNSLRSVEADSCAESSLGVHSIQTRVYKGRRNTRVEPDLKPITSKFAIISKGTTSDVVLPNLKYNDPLNSWTSTSCSTKEGIFSTAIEASWKRAGQGNQKKRFEGDMAEFSLYCQKDEKGFESVEINLEGKFARKKKNQCQHLSLIDVWAHNPRIDALYSHITDTDDGNQELDKLLLHYNKYSEEQKANLMKEKCVIDFIEKYELTKEKQLPVSFKHPTMQVQHSILPVINHLGVYCLEQDPVPGCLVTSCDNRGHLKAAKQGDPPREFNAGHMRDLIEHHDTQMKKQNSFKQSNKPSTSHQK